MSLSHPKAASRMSPKRYEKTLVLSQPSLEILKVSARCFPYAPNIISLRQSEAE